jgi:hypothetical protein
VTCHYADDPGGRTAKAMQLWPTDRWRSCSSCNRRRSAVGKGEAPRRLPPGQVPGLATSRPRSPVPESGWLGPLRNMQTWLQGSELLKRSNDTATQFNALQVFNPISTDHRPAPSVRGVVRKSASKGRVWWFTSMLLRMITLLKMYLHSAGERTRTSNPVSRPNPKFDAGLSGPSRAVRLVPVCAAQSGIGAGIRPVRRAFVLASAAGSVRSFVRSPVRSQSPRLRSQASQSGALGSLHRPVDLATKSVTSPSRMGRHSLSRVNDMDSRWGQGGWSLGSANEDPRTDGVAGTQSPADDLTPSGPCSVPRSR